MKLDLKLNLSEFLTDFDKKKTILVAGVSLGVLFIDVAFLLTAQVKGITSLSPRITKLQDTIAALKKDYANMEKLKKEHGSLKADAAAKSKRIIVADDVPALLESISKADNKNAIRIMQISAAKEAKEKNKEESKPKFKGPKGKKEKPAALEDNFDTYLITIELLGDYHNLGNFLAQLDTLDTVVIVSAVTISSDQGDFLHQQVNLALKTYVKK